MRSKQLLNTSAILRDRPMRIILARHGKPLTLNSRWIAPCEIAQWCSSYDDADIGEQQEIPERLVEASRRSPLVAASTLRRSVSSAARLTGAHSVFQEPVFREAELPYTLWRYPKLPAPWWVMIFRIAWFCGFHMNAESVDDATARARSGAKQLIRLAHEHRTVLLVGHGVMLRMLAMALRGSGWKGQVPLGFRYWASSEFHAPGKGA